jgi:hypothetical protein
LPRINVDARSIERGWVLFQGGYADQPYVVTYPDGEWLSVITVSDEGEGDSSQRIVSMRSTDQGATWSLPDRLESDTTRAASWGLPFLTSYGRVYVFYTFNSQGLTEVPTDSGPTSRVDTLGDFVFRFSDDRGHTWSERFIVPVRQFDVDLANDFHGDVRYWWGVGKPTLIDGSVYIGATKVGKFGDPQLIFQMHSEGFIVRSSNLDIQRDPLELHWETLPEGTKGIKVPDGVVSEEHKVFGEGPSLFCTFRTQAGFVAQGTSMDGGLTWSTDYARYRANERPLKNPRAATFTWNCGGGRYLLWFHNNSHITTGQSFRNPVWIAAGREEGGVVRWSQPEIALYSVEHDRGISYPDLIIDRGRYFLTETNKSIARIHALPEAILLGLWAQATIGEVPTEAMSLELLATDATPVVSSPFTTAGAGYSIELWLGKDALQQGRTLWQQAQVGVFGGEGNRLRILLGGTFEWVSDPIEFESDEAAAHVVIIVDVPARALLIVANGTLQDGGDGLLQGWGRMPVDFNDEAPHGAPTIASATEGRIGVWRAYDRPIRVSEAISSFLVGPAGVA